MPLSYQARDALIRRITATHSQRPIALLLGAPLTMPEDGSPGVPGVKAMLDLLDAALRHAGLDSDLYRRAEAGEDAGALYQSGFKRLIEEVGVDVANNLVRHAVSRALDDPMAPPVDDVQCRGLMRDDRKWYLRRSVLSLGRILAAYPERFPLVLTTNFDPLIEIAVRRAGGAAHRTVLHSDGYLGSHASERGTHVAYLHGYWFGSDTLHTTTQLTQERHQLLGSLREVLRNHTLLQLGYGGWDDIIMRTLRDVTSDHAINADVLWTSRSDAAMNPCARIGAYLNAGVDRQRVRFYSGVDLHETIPAFERELGATRKRVEVVFLSRHERVLGQIIGKLNTCQDQFLFIPADDAARDEVKRLAEFSTDRIDAHAATRGAAALQPTAYLTIVIIDKPLHSEVYPRLFGHHSQRRRIAIVTTTHTDALGLPPLDYVRYYLVRYVLGQCTRIKNHVDTRNCLFDRKERMSDIWLSLRSGRMCDACDAKNRHRGALDEAMYTACSQIRAHMMLEHSAPTP